MAIRPNPIELKWSDSNIRIRSRRVTFANVKIPGSLVPLTFVPCCRDLAYERQNQRSTSKILILVRLWISHSHLALAAANVKSAPLALYAHFDITARRVLDRRQRVTA